MKISIIGAGYVGLVSGACFAEFGHIVTCVDKDLKKIKKLEEGKIPFYEPGLDSLVLANVEKGRLSFTTKIAPAVESAGVIFIAVGTPPRGDGSADLKYVEGVAREIAGHMNEYKVIVTKSTVPVGTGERLRKIISKHLSEHIDFDIVSNPEFLREGAAIEDFMRPNRVVIGGDSPKALEAVKELYKPLFLRETPFVITDMRTAELIKYASNSFLATKISFINEMAVLSEELGADVSMVAKGMGLDRRISPFFLHPGPGYGGSCFPKDVHALMKIGHDAGVELKILKSVIDVNHRQVEGAYRKIKRAMGGVKGKTIAVLGLSFKPNTDDMREAPSIGIIQSILRDKGSVRAYDPAAMENAKAVLPEISYTKDEYSAMKGADGLVILTEWNEFRSLDMERVKRLIKPPYYFFDLRNIYEPEKMRAAGFKYFSTGRGFQRYGD